MCNPAFIAFGLQAASIGVGYQAQKAQADYQNQMAHATAANARQAAINDYNQSFLREMEEEAATVQKIDMQLEQMRQAQARARVSAGEAGVAGLSVDALSRDIAGQAASNISVLNQNAHMASRQAMQDRRAIETTGQSRVNQAASSMSAGPSLLGAALQIGGAGVEAYDKYQTRKKGG